MARNDKGEVIFDADEQAKVDAIVQERVARVKNEKPADYDDLQEIAAELKKLGYTGQTPAELLAEARAEADYRAAQVEMKALEQKATDTGASPDLLKEIADLKKDLAVIKAEREAKNAEQKEQQRKQDEINAQFAAFESEYPDVDLDALTKDPKFVKFSKNKNETISEIYKDFVDLIDKAEIAALTKARDKDDRSTGGGKGKSDGGTYGLTPRQQQLALENDMTFKEYADLLPKKKG